MADRDAGQVRLTEDEKRSLVGAAQRALIDGETGMANGDCNRAGWHVGEVIATTVESILAARLAEITAERSHAEFRLAEVASVAEERGYEVQAQRDRAEAAEAALAARQSDPDATEEVQWGVRFGDGEVETPMDSDGSPPTRYEAERLRTLYRTDIANPDTNHAAEDYEPMTLVTRLVRRTVTTGEWTEVGE